MPQRANIGGLPTFVVSMGLVLIGCGAARHADEADALVVVPASEARLDGLGSETWCTDFGDAGLDAVIARTWEENLELKAAWARLNQAEALADIARAERLPVAEAGAGLSYGQRASDELETTTDVGPETLWELSAAASYEVDIWGRHAHRARAARLRVDAAEASARATAMSLTSEVAEAWFDVVAQLERIRLLDAQLALSRDTLELIRIRLRHGVGDALDAAQQEQNVESIEGQLILAHSELATSRHRLGVLSGSTPEGSIAAEGATLPPVPPIPSAGVPADLVERRPDVRAAHLELEAADAVTAAAVADRLPRLQLQAEVGFGAANLAALFSQLFWSLGAGIVQPIFEGGRLRAEVAHSEAVAAEQLYVYANTLLVALREVYDALALEAYQADRLESLEREQAIASTALGLAQRRYRSGAVDYLRVLTALQAQQEVERTLLEARRQQISYRISLCRALGGSWVRSVTPSIEVEE